MHTQVGAVHGWSVGMHPHVEGSHMHAIQVWHHTMHVITSCYLSGHAVGLHQHNDWR